MKPLLVLTLLFLAAYAAGADVEFTHTLSWRKPAKGEPRPSTIEAVWDGKSLGVAMQSDKLLAEIDVSSKDVIRIDMPIFKGTPKLEAFLRQQPPYEYSRYIVNWYDKGCSLHFFRDGKEYPVHTLAHQGFGHLREKTSGPPHLFFDGKDLGPTDSAIEKMDKYNWEKDAVLQLPGYSSMVLGQLNPQTDPDSLTYFLRRVTAVHGVTVEDLMGAM